MNLPLLIIFTEHYIFIMVQINNYLLLLYKVLIKEYIYSTFEYYNVRKGKLNNDINS